jgi:integrase
VNNVAAELRVFAPDVRVSSRSLWADEVWYLDGIPPAANRSDFILNWTFEMGTELLPGLTWIRWREAAKTFLWSLKIDPPPGHPGVHDTSLATMFKMLRMLMRWMAGQGYRRFADLNRDASERFLAVIAARRGNNGTPMKPATLQNYRRMLSQLYIQGARYPEVAIADPSLGMGWGGRASDKGWLPYTPDTLAVALVSAALRLLGTPADEVIALHATAQSAYEDGLARGLSQSKTGRAVANAIATYRFSTLPNELVPWHASPGRSTKVVRQLVDRIYEACFVAVAYLVGARVSEIIGLKTKCIEHHPAADGNETFAYLVGRIYKTATTDEGNVHRWVAPPAVERAIAVMERLTEPMRRRTQRNDLWLAMTSSGLLGPRARITVPNGGTIVRRLNSGFAPFINLPLHQGKRWHLNTHQGRKTFARFVGKRDRTGLHALQGHLGHLSRVMTDRGYVGTDFALDELIDRHAQEETRAGLEELLTATALGGKGGRTIASRSQFRGRTRDGNLQTYVDFLMAETDLRLGVCDWGYCVYRPETSACLGNEKGPNPVLRTESICASCVNFAVTTKHRPVWEARRARNVALLEQPALDPQSRGLVAARTIECDRILAQLDQDGALRHE